MIIIININVLMCINDIINGNSNEILLLNDDIIINIININININVY